MSELSIGIILGSTRPGRRGDQVAQWVLEQASTRNDASYHLIDLADFPLPLLDEPVPAMMGQYAHEHTKLWSAAVSQHDGYVFVTPEYNHSTSGVLKNALDYLNKEWNNKAAGFVSYGYSAAGMRAVEHLRLVVSELQIAHVREQVAISIAQDFADHTTLKPLPHHESGLSTMLDQVVAWSGALKGLRAATTA
ncbi:MAG: NADPH-dependent FMN reductase [Rhodoglobus sp.]